MNVRTVVLLLVGLIFLLFAALNWSVFMAPTTLSLGITEVQAPFGLIMLGLMALLATLFLVYVVYLQSSVLMETRRSTRELQAQRELADKAEASRFTELREYLATELKVLSEENAALKATMLTRMEQLESELQTAVEQSGNSLSAYVGELGDRLDHNRLSGPSV